MRYVVTELEGYLTPRECAGRQGLSVHVIDTLWNRRLCATFRSEDYGGNGRGVGAKPHDEARRRAHEHAARLNGFA